MYYIYEIYNKVTKRKYIGMTLNYEKRFNTHMNHLRYGDHTERLMQKDYVLYGRDSFDYRLLEMVNDRTYAHQREKHYMTIFKTSYDEYGYNGQDVIFNKYQNTNESVNSQNYFFQKIKETGLPLYKVAEKIGISRKSLIRGITHIKSMKMSAFLELINLLNIDKKEAVEYLGWGIPISEEIKETLGNFSALSENEQNLILEFAQTLVQKKQTERG